MSGDDNIILFPGLRTTLEQESLTALSNKDYSRALEKLNQLVGYGVDHHEIVMGKLICLMELDRFDEAEDLAEHLIVPSHQHYYEYLHMYLIILFQMAEYDRLIEVVEEEQSSGRWVPADFYKPFMQLLDLSKQMRDEVIMEQSAKLMGQLHKAYQEEHHHKQWMVLEELRQIGAVPRQSVVYYLTDTSVHPMTKTSLFEWYREQGVNQDMEVHKMGLSGQFNPTEILPMQDQPVYQQTQLLISELEQDDPTLSRLLQDLLIRFFYVRYPLLPNISDAHAVADAIKQIGMDMLSIHNEHNQTDLDPLVSQYIYETNLCDGLYLSVMDA